MIRLIRSSLFAIFMPLWTILCGTTGIFLLIGPDRWMDYLARTWAKGVLSGLKYICAINHQIIGEENIPNTPSIIAAKHQSAWDTAIFLVLFNFPSYILKQQLLKVPFYGWFLPRMGTIPIDREGGASTLKAMIKSTKQRLQEQRHVIIFPQGTRVKPGVEFPYHPGVAALYNSCNVPVIPVALNSGYFWSKRQFLKNPGTITMQFFPAIEPGLKRKAFMEQLENTVETKSQELINEVSNG